MEISICYIDDICKPPNSQVPRKHPFGECATFGIAANGNTWKSLCYPQTSEELNKLS